LRQGGPLSSLIARHYQHLSAVGSHLTISKDINFSWAG
jgi:hypothetical protein